jgi:hypothetical protein
MTGIAKAWVNYNGSAGTITGSFNVGSVTKNSTGNYTVNFTTAMANATYAMAGSCTSDAFTGRTATVSPYYTGTYSTAAIQIFTKDSADNTIDSARVAIAIFGA